MKMYQKEDGFTKEELIKLGVDYDKMNYPFGELNIIVQWFGRSKCNAEGKEDTYAYPSYYQPRREKIWTVSNDEIDLSNKEQREDFIKQLKDSSERLKVLSLLLARQAQELEETGFTSTMCYYPEESK
jgi:hypothetical protein